jgi:hypothetical protein
LPIVMMYWGYFSMIDTPLCNHPKCLGEPFLHFTIFQIFGVFLSLMPTLTQSLGCESTLGSQHIAWTLNPSNCFSKFSTKKCCFYIHLMNGFFFSPITMRAKYACIHCFQCKSLTTIQFACLVGMCYLPSIMNLTCIILRSLFYHVCSPW